MTLRLALSALILIALLLCACGTSSLPTPEPSAAPVPRGWMARILKDSDRLEASGVQWFYIDVDCERKCEE